MKRRDMQDTPPDGYEIINIGNVRRNDLCFDWLTGEWVHPNNQTYYLLGSDVEYYYAVARRVK